MTTNKAIRIPASELSYLFSRSGGPGGQNVNKIESKVTVVFDYKNSNVLSEDQKRRIELSKIVRGCLDSSGRIAVTSQEHRTQVRNREAAINRLHDILELALRKPKKRVPTRKTRASELKRVEVKRARSATKSGRRKSWSGSD